MDEEQDEAPPAEWGITDDSHEFLRDEDGEVVDGCFRRVPAGNSDYY
jgi:hypothetical protein